MLARADRRLVHRALGFGEATVGSRVGGYLVARAIELGLDALIGERLLIERPCFLFGLASLRLRRLDVPPCRRGIVVAGTCCRFHRPGDLACRARRDLGLRSRLPHPRGIEVERTRCAGRKREGLFYDALHVGHVALKLALDLRASFGGAETEIAEPARALVEVERYEGWKNVGLSHGGYPGSSGAAFGWICSCRCLSQRGCMPAL